jgi:hypothetical protein
MLNTELVIAKIQKQIFHIPDFFLFSFSLKLFLIAGKTVT